MRFVPGGLLRTGLAGVQASQENGMSVQLILYKVTLSARMLLIYVICSKNGVTDLSLKSWARSF